MTCDSEEERNAHRKQLDLSNMEDMLGELVSSLLIFVAVAYAGKIISGLCSLV